MVCQIIGPGDAALVDIAFPTAHKSQKKIDLHRMTSVREMKFRR